MDNRPEGEQAACPHSPGIASSVTDETDPLRDSRPVSENAACPHPPTLAEMEKAPPPLPATQEYVMKERLRFEKDQERQVKCRK